MNSKSTYFYHAFLSILFAAVMVSCGGETQQSSEPSYPVMKKPATAKKSDIPSEVKSLLAKSTCLGCHKVDKKLIGPSYQDIAARGYSEEEIVALIKQPVPENWADYPPMAPITWVADEDLATIATWITSLELDEQE
jgi:cytochrome c551/c552